MKLDGTALRLTVLIGEADQTAAILGDHPEHPLDVGTERPAGRLHA